LTLSKIRQLLKTYRFRTLAEETEARKEGAMVNNPEYLLSVIQELEPENGKIVVQALGAFQFKLVLNQLRKQDNPKLGALICRIIDKHLGLPLQFAGNVSYDDLVHDAVCQKVPFLDKYLHTQTAMDLERFCKNILGARNRREGSGPAGEALEMTAAGQEQ
jgi:MinD-like ATPase involved in chromosome partitioning or flagellar assembly